MRCFHCLYLGVLLVKGSLAEAAQSASPKYATNTTFTSTAGTASGYLGTRTHPIPSTASPNHAANATITSMVGTASAYSRTVGQSNNASMCAVQAHGLAPILDGPPGPADISTACSCNSIVSSVVTDAPTVVYGMNSDGSVWSATETVKSVLNPAYTPPTDCCVECLITAADVQILYWPVETASSSNLSTANNLSITATPPAATPFSYVDNGITFISPSVYVAYRSLNAAHNCPAFGPKYFGQGNATDVTIGYPPEALSTSMCDGAPAAGFQIYTAINYTELQYPTGAQTQGTCQWRLGSSGTPRGPYLSIPTNINNVDPAWSSCKGAFEGSFDPPSALRKATAMVASTPAPDKGPSATPGPSIAPANPPPTATPAPLDPGSGGENSVPASPRPPKSNTPSSDPVNGDPGNAGSVDGDPAKSANPPAGADHGSPAASLGDPNPASSQNGASGASDPPHISNPGNAQPASSNGATNPQTEAAGTGPGTESGTGSGSESGSGSSHGLGAGSGSGAEAGSGAGAGSSSTPTPNSVIANGNTVVRDPNGGVVVGSSTIMPGSTAQVAGAPLSVGSDHVVLGSSSYALPAATTAGALLVGSSPIVKAANGGVIIGGSPIAPGVQTAVAGHTVSIGSSQAVVDGSTYPLPASAGAVVQAAPAQTPVLVGSQSIVKAPNGGIVVGSSTIAPGTQATIAGHAVSVGSSAAVVDGTTYALPTNPGAFLQQAPNLAQNLALSSKVTLANGAVITAGSAPATVDGTVVAIPSNDNGLIVNGKTVPLPTPARGSVLTAAGQTFTAAPTGFTVAGQSLSPGGSAITLSGTVLSLGPSGLQIGTSTVPIPPAAAASVFTIAGQTFTAAPTGFAIDGQKLSPGGSAITLSGTVLSLGPSGLQIGTSTIPLPSSPNSIFTVAGQTFTAAPTGFTLNGQTISPGGSAITLSGTLISLGPSGLQIGTSTIPLPSSPTSTFTVAGQTFTAAPTGFTLNGQTISPGGSALTLSGTIISLGPSGLQIGSSTIPLPFLLNSIFTVAGQTFTAAPTGFAIGSQTLLPGGSAITLSGTIISLGPSGLEIGTSIIPLTPAEQSADVSAGLGGLIMGGYGANPTNGSGIVGFTGAGSRIGYSLSIRPLAVLIGLGVGAVAFVL